MSADPRAISPAASRPASGGAPEAERARIRGQRRCQPRHRRPGLGLTALDCGFDHRPGAATGPPLPPSSTTMSRWQRGQSAAGAVKLMACWAAGH